MWFTRGSCRNCFYLIAICGGAQNDVTAAADAITVTLDRFQVVEQIDESQFGIASN
jgi:hypothetical protein